MTEYVGQIFSGEDAAAAANASRSKYGPLTDPESDGDGIGALRSDEGRTARAKAQKQLAAQPRLIEKKEIYALTAKGGRAPGWMKKGDTESGSVGSRSALIVPL